MPQEQLFALANMAASAGWLTLALVPLRFAWPRLVAIAIALGMAATYTALIGVHWASASGGFGSLLEVAHLFENRGMLLAGWVHYLAFDLLLGVWIRDEARRIALPLVAVVPCLLLTFLLGPLGWLAFLGLRLFRLRIAAPGIQPPVGMVGSAVHRLTALPRALHDAQPHLAAGALLALLALAPVLIAMALDPRSVNGINIWIKPAKFLVSFVVYLGTLAWVFAWLPRDAAASASGRAIVMIALGACGLEGLWLVAAAASGVPSHFNVGSPVWGAAYLAAGIGAVAMIGVILWQGVLVARQAPGAIPAALRLALVLGAAIACAATLVTAGYLSSGTGHWVGGTASDAGGLKLLGWSRDGGDLRVAHFFALHAQQAIPLLGLLLVKLGRPDTTALVWLGAAAYAGLIGFTFIQALAGLPFLPWLG